MLRRVSAALLGLYVFCAPYLALAQQVPHPVNGPTTSSVGHTACFSDVLGAQSTDCTPRAVDVRTFGAKCDGATDDSAAFTGADAVAGIGELGVYATCRLSNDLTLTHHLYVGPQGALSVDAAKTLTVAGVTSDSATPFLGAGTVVNGANPSFTNKLAVSIKPTGTVVATDTFLNQILIPSDAMNAAGNNVWGLAINETCCTSAAKGQRFLLGARLDITGASNAADPLPAYVAVFGNTRAMVAAPNASAGVWGGNFNTQLNTGATGWAEAQGAEHDVTVQAGASAVRKAGISIVQGPTDAVHGSSTDAAVALYNATGATAPWNNILDLDNNTTPVISTSGTIIRTRGPVTFSDVVKLDTGAAITNGLNLTNATVSNAVVLGPGASSYIKGDGSAFFNGVTQGIGNGIGVYPTSLSGWALTTNFAGSSEVDFWNTYNSGGAFRWYQKTGASAATQVGALADAGALATTGLTIRINNTGAGLSLSAVSLGAADSGGAGRRALTVAN